MELSFNELRVANLARVPEFRNAKGEIAHPDGLKGWALSQWMNALTGEVGEAANIIKKIERGDFNLADARGSLADELADIQIYLDLVAARCGINLGAATILKFNRVSDRVGSSIYLKRP